MPVSKHRKKPKKPMLQKSARTQPNAGVVRPGFAPDFGITMWNAGRRDVDLFVYMKMSIMCDYGDFCEVSGHLHLDNGSFAVTVRTPQSKEPLAEFGPLRQFNGA